MYHMTLKKIISLLLCVCMLLSALSACKGSTNGGGNNGGANGTSAGRVITEADLKEISSRVDNINKGEFATSLSGVKPASFSSNTFSIQYVAFAETDTPHVALLTASSPSSDEVPDLKAMGMDMTWEEYVAALRMGGMNEYEIEVMKQGLLDAERGMKEAFGEGSSTNTNTNTTPPPNKPTYTDPKKEIKDAPNPPVVNNMPKKDEEIADWAINAATEMTLWTVRNEVDGSVVKGAGFVVTQYPHPLVLNNYAAMIQDFAPYDALYFFLLANELQPGCPLILQNIAAVYLNIGDKDAAKRYAEEAVSFSEEAGEAWQILAIIYLGDKDYVKAAQCLLKGAVMQFDETTIRLFDALLEGLGELDPFNGDEFPLTDDDLQNLYNMAKKYVDSGDIREDIDTPAGQYSVPQMPQFMSEKHFADSYDYLTNTSWKYLNKSSAENSTYSSLRKEIRNGKDEYGFNCLRNMRQYYAYQILDVYYEFKHEELHKEYSDKFQAIKDSAPSYYEFDDGVHEGGGLLWTYNPDYSVEVTAGKKTWQSFIDYYPMMMDIYKTHWNKESQLIEEEWLRKGAMLQYFTDETVFTWAEIERRSGTYHDVAHLYGLLESKAYDYYWGWDCCKNVWGEGTTETMNLYPAEGENVEDLPEITLKNFEEGLPPVGVSVDKFGFGVSANFDGSKTNFTLKLQGQEYGASFDYDEQAITLLKPAPKSAFEVGAEAAKVHVRGNKYVQGVNIGQIVTGDTTAAHLTRQTYTTYNADGRVTDRGIVTKQSINADVGAAGVTRTTTVTRSLYTGVGIKSQATQFRFMFGSVGSN